MQRSLAGEKARGGRGDLRLRLEQRRLHGVDARHVDVAVVANGQQQATLGGQIVQRLDEGRHRVPAVQVQAGQQRLLAGLGLGHGARRLLADALDLLELVEHQLGGGGDLAQQRRQLADLGGAQPVVGVEQAAHVLAQLAVALHRHRRGVDLAAQVAQLGHPAHQLGVADAAEKAAARRLAGGELVAGERRLPDLHRMDTRRLRALGGEDHHAPVLQARVAVAEDRAVQLAFDQVVGEQRRATLLGLVEHVEHVLAVGRAHRALEAHAGHRLVEGPGLAALQVVTAGEDDAVVLGQLHAGLADGVDALDLAGQAVEHQVAPLFLAVRQHLEQDQAAEASELDLRVVQRLGLVRHRLAVDAQAILGVVLDLDGQIAADGLDEHRVEDVEVRMAAVDHHLATGFLPLEVVGLRQGDIALAAVVDVAHLAAIHRDRPAEHADVGQPLTDLEAGQQLAIPHHQLQQAGVLVVGVQLAEVLHEAGLAEEAALQRLRLGIKALRRLAQAV
ncbi:hypothetical protein D3C80_969860 [compost metagenome]